MAAKIIRPPQPANPTIDEVCEEFLAEQRKRLTPRTLSRYEDVLGLLRHHLNGYAHVKGGAKLDHRGGGKLDHPAVEWRV